MTDRVMCGFRTVICGDARDLKKDVPDGSVQTLVVSVPYWGLRAYFDHPDEIGREDTLQQWIDNLVACAREWRRTLREDGTAWVNCGDSYASASLSDRTPNPELSGVHPTLPERKPPSDGLKPKDLIGLPWQLAFALQNDGWYLRSAIVWAKGLDWSDAERAAQAEILDALALVRERAAGSLFGLDPDLERALMRAEKMVDRLAMSGAVMPESTKDRPTTSYEFLFLLSKSEQYYYDGEAIKVPGSENTHPRGNGRTPKGELAQVGVIRANASFHEATSDHVFDGRNARTVWRVPSELSPPGGYRLSDGRTVAHFATFPRALPARAILAGTSEYGACAKCGAPFVRVTVPTNDYAELLGQDWADYEQDTREGRGHSVSGQRPTKRGRTVTASYVTVGWEPTCTCYGKPLDKPVPCPKCKGTGRELRYPGRNDAAEFNRSGRKHSGPLEANPPTSTGNPCPVCLCPDCKGAGKELATASRQSEHMPEGGRRKSGKRGVTGNLGENSMIETGNPCPTCNGVGATGRINGKVWPEGMLEKWPVRPCIVLDPMAGTGQTGMAALDLGRSVILNDLTPDYCDLMRERLAAWPGDVPGARNGNGKDEEAVEELPLFEGASL